MVEVEEEWAAWEEKETGWLMYGERESKERNGRFRDEKWMRGRMGYGRDRARERVGGEVAVQGSGVAGGRGEAWQ